MTLPRRLTLIGKEQLAIQPAGDIESLRGKHTHVTPVAGRLEMENIYENNAR